MPKHQGQPEKRMTDAYTMSNRGATKHQQSTRAGKNPQSSMKSQHQGQPNSKSGTAKYQGRGRGSGNTDMSKKPGGGSISGTSGKKIKSSSGGMSY